MNLQRRTINRYRQIFPTDTLREISSRTGIQITRVHRLLSTNKPMKVGELEAFERCIQEKNAENPNLLRLGEVLNQASVFLEQDELSKIIDYIERKSVARKYGRLYATTDFRSAILA